MSITLEQKAAADKFFADFQAALLPAVLEYEGEKGYTNGIILKSECVNKRGWPYTVENLVKVVNEILLSDVLIWKVPPAKLAASKNAKLNAPASRSTEWKDKT